MREFHDTSHDSTTSIHALFSPSSFSSSLPLPSSFSLSSFVLFVSELLNFPSLPRSGFWAAMLMGACAFQIQRLLPSKDSIQTEFFFTRISKETKIFIFFLLRQKTRKRVEMNEGEDGKKKREERGEEEEEGVMMRGDSSEMRRWTASSFDMKDDEEKETKGRVTFAAETRRLPFVGQAISGCRKRRRRRTEKEQEDERRLRTGRDLTDEERRREESRIAVRKRRRRRRKSLESFLPASSLSFSSISWFLSAFRFPRDQREDEEDDSFLTRYTQKKESLADPFLLSVQVDKEEEEERKEEKNKGEEERQCLSIRDRRSPPPDVWKDLKDKQGKKNSFIVSHHTSSSSSSSSSSYSPPSLSENIPKTKEEKKEEEEDEKVDERLQLSLSRNHLTTSIDTRDVSKNQIFPSRRSLLSSSLLSSSSLRSTRATGSQVCRFSFLKTEKPGKDDEKREKEETKKKGGDEEEEEFEKKMQAKKKKKRNHELSVWGYLIFQIFVRLSVVSILLYFLFTWPEGTPKTLDLETLVSQERQIYDRCKIDR